MPMLTVPKNVISLSFVLPIFTCFPTQVFGASSDLLLDCKLRTENRVFAPPAFHVAPEHPAQYFEFSVYMIDTEGNAF